MAQVGERKIVLFPSTAAAAGTVADGNPVNVAGYTAAIIALNVSAISVGTSLDVYIQQEIPIVGAGDKWGAVPTGTSVWDDLVHFTQVTTTPGTWIARIVGSTNVAAPQKDATLAAATMANGPIGSNWRVKYVAVGTLYTFAVTAILIP